MDSDHAYGGVGGHRKGAHARHYEHTGTKLAGIALLPSVHARHMYADTQCLSVVPQELRSHVISCCHAKKTTTRLCSHRHEKSTGSRRIRGVWCSRLQQPCVLHFLQRYSSLGGSLHIPRLAVLLQIVRMGRRFCFGE